MFRIDGAKTITLPPLETTMRTAFSLVTLLLISTTLATMAVSAEVISDGSNITVSGTETWNESSIDTDLTVLEGASLLIENTTSIAQDVTITVNEGATLTVSGDLIGTELDAGLLVFNDTLLHLNFGDIADTGQVRINFDHVIPESAMFNVTIGNETQNAVGADFVDIPASLNGTSLTVEFDIYYFFSTQITSVQALHSGASGTVLVNAEELNHTAGSLKWNAAAFELQVFGTLSVNDADVSGASIVCSGTCSVTDATLTGSAPIHVQDGGSLVVESSVLVGSRTDEDIIVHDTANIQYTNSTGTGGLTDAWIRLLSQRTLHTNAGNITVHATGLGYYGSTIDNITDQNGHVGIALGEQARIVEWVDGEGQYHEENAEIVLTLSSSWGNFATTVSAPKTPISEVSVPLPYIDVVSIDLEDNKAYIGQKISGDIVVKNTGDVAVTGVNFWCYVGDELQDTTQLVVSLEAGESKTMYVSWYGNTNGSLALECRAMLPTVLNSIASDVSNPSGSASGEIAWTNAEEREDQPLMIYALLVLIVLAGTFVVSHQASKKVIQSQQSKIDEEEAAKEYLDDEEALEEASSLEDEA